MLKKFLVVSCIWTTKNFRCHTRKLSFVGCRGKWKIRGNPTVLTASLFQIHPYTSPSILCAHTATCKAKLFERAEFESRILCAQMATWKTSRVYETIPQGWSQSFLWCRRYQSRKREHFHPNRCVYQTTLAVHAHMQRLQKICSISSDTQRTRFFPLLSILNGNCNRGIKPPFQSTGIDSYST